MRLILAGFFCLVVSAAPARAECPLMRLTDYVRSDRITAVFRGTVREVQPVPVGQVVTFAVDRVWKGDVTEVVTIYNLQGESESSRFVESVTFERGQAYLVAAHRHNAEDRRMFGLSDSDPETFGTGSCDAHRADAIHIFESVPGHPPAWRSQ